MHMDLEFTKFPATHDARNALRRVKTRARAESKKPAGEKAGI